MIILIAEDHPDSRLVLQRTLESAGHTVLAAVNGEEALNKAKSTPPDLIISDILMPVMDGFKLCYAVKQDEQLCHIPFIFYTATYIDIEDEQLALKLGADRFLVKPLDPMDLLKIMDEITAEMAQEKKELAAVALAPKEDLFEQYDVRLSKKLTKKTREMDQYKSFFENSQDLFCILTSQGEIAQLNEATCRFYNSDEQQLLGRSAKEFFGESCFNAMLEKVSNKHQYHAEIETQTRSGTCTYLDVTALPYLDEHSSLNAVLVQARDIGARKIAEALRLDLEAQLAQKHKIEALGLMAGGMAHNFNNNLAIILGGIDLVRLKLPSDSDVLPLLDNAKIAVLRSRDLIQNILSYSRQGVLNREAVQMALVVDETLQMLRSTIPATVKVNYQPNIPCQDRTIQADATRIQEALINLCNNAIQAMDERGELTIAINEVELHSEDIPAQYQCAPGSYLQLSVQDTGCGMSPDIIEKIFDPFFTTKSIEKGTGMGLASLQGMVLQQGGLIKVYSVPGQGSNFEIYFPISVDAKPALNPTDTRLPRGSEKIIFLDDDEELANMGESLLAELGYQVCAMTSSRETLKLFQANQDYFDLLITDQTMPDMTGLELIHELRKIRPRFPAILCTGYSSKVDESRASQLGINAYLMKPLELTKLSQTVRSVLDSFAQHQHM